MSANNENLRIAVVGLGMGRGQIKKFAAIPNVDVAAICDTDAERLAETKDEHGVEHAYTDFDEMLKGESLNAVVIATPNNTHHPLSLKAFDHGLHVLCEKPLAVNGSQAAEMVQAADNAGRKLGVHYNHRMSPSAQLVKQYIDDEELGEVYYIRSVWHRRKGIPAGASGWFYRKETAGGGCFVDLGVHMIDMALTFANFPTVLSVTGQLHNKFADVDLPGKNMDVDDFGTAYIRCEGGLSIAVEISWASHARESGMCTEVYGTDGGAVRLKDGVEIMRREHGQLANTYFPAGVKNSDMPSVQGDFVQAIRENREPLCSGRQGLLLMRILDAVAESSRTGHEVTFET